MEKNAPQPSPNPSLVEPEKSVTMDEDIPMDATDDAGQPTPTGLGVSSSTSLSTSIALSTAEKAVDADEVCNPSYISRLFI